jgi:hypothetical protein
VDGVSKGQQRALTAVGAIVGLIVGYFVFNGVIGNRMIEAPRFVLAVLLGGGVGMILYTLIKDGGTLVLKRQQASKTAAPPPPPTPPAAPVDEPPPAPARQARKEPLRARERPLKPRSRD